MLHSDNLFHLLIQLIGKLLQQSRAVSSPRASVHARKRRGLGGRKPIDHLSSVLCVREIIQTLPQCLARAKDIGFRQRLGANSGLSEQVAA